MFFSCFFRFFRALFALANATVRGWFADSAARPIKSFFVQGQLAVSITRNGNSEPSVRILRAMCLHCQECKCVFYLLVDSQRPDTAASNAICPDCGSQELTSFELLE